MKQPELIVSRIFGGIDTIIEFYLGSFIKPFLSVHEVFYSALNKVLRKALDDNKQKIPVWFTANFITYFRTALVIPTLLLLAWDFRILSASIVILVDFGDFLDGVVARFWVDAFNEQNAEDKKRERSSSPTTSDSDSFGKHPQSICALSKILNTCHWCI